MGDFAIAVSLTLKHEGGFQNSENDKGNWTGGQIGVGQLKGTKYGISAAQFPDEDIPNLTVPQAMTIYRTKYWNELYDNIKDQLICNKLFDLGVLFGQGTAVKVLQTILASKFHIGVDGIFGLGTLLAVNAAEPTSLLVAYKNAFVARAEQAAASNPAEQGYVAGWVSRINS